MAQPVRAFDDTGIERFRIYLARLRAGDKIDPPWELLEDPGCTIDLSVEAWVEPQVFASRWGLGEHLWSRLARLPGEEVEANRGLWAWLSLFYFEQVCPARPDRRPGADYRHIPDFSFRHRYRHLLYGPYAVYRRHKGHAILVLSGPLHVEQAVYQEITSRLDLIASRGVMEAVNLLYLDRRRGVPKRGVQSSAQPGTLRRFVRVLQQLDVTYDIYGMSGQEIIDLLPPEFDPWRPARSPLAGVTLDPL